MSQSAVPEALMKQYIASFTQKIMDLNGLYLNVRQFDEDAEKALISLKELRFYVHNLAGSGGIYGFSDITLAARECLQVLDTFRFESTQLEVLDKKILQLKAHLEAASV